MNISYKPTFPEINVAKNILTSYQKLKQQNENTLKTMKKHLQT